MRKQVASGALAGTATVASTVVGMMWQTIDPLIGKWILVACGAVFVAAVIVFLWPGKGQQGGGLEQTSHGQHSPNFGTVGGDVHIYPPPAETQPRKSPYGGWTDESLAGLERVARGLSGRRSFEDVLAGRGAHEGCPETPIWQALTVIASRIGDKDESNGFPKARTQFRQAALDGILEVWGQADIPPQHLEDNRHKEVWNPIEPIYWRDYTLNVLAADPRAQEHWHTEDEEVPGRRGNRYWNLKVRLDHISRRWPNLTPPPLPPHPTIPSTATAWNRRTK